jgi:uncharacterized membrane protein
MWLELLAVLFVTACGVLAGVLFCVAMAVVPVLGTFPPDRYIQAHVLLDRRFDPLMPRLNKAALAMCAVLVVFSHGYPDKLAFLFAGLCVVGVAVVSELFNVRMNREVGTWDPSRPPAGWHLLRARWAAANRARTVLAIVGFAVAVAGTAVR